jgi:hypothetical protein
MTETPEQIMDKVLRDYMMHSGLRDFVISKLKAALKAAGFVIVPVEPTEAMIDAAMGGWGDREGREKGTPGRKFYAEQLAGNYRAAIKQGKQ